jgi:methyl-accepting chemotaxis protein
MITTVRSRIGLKFNLVVGLVVLAMLGLMVGITIRRQSATLEAGLHSLGENTGVLLARMSVDPLLFKDVMKLDATVEGARGVPGLLYAYVADKEGKPLTSLLGSMNPANPVAKALADEGKLEVAAAVTLLKGRLDVHETVSPILVDEDQIGTVVVGISREENLRALRANELFFALFGVLIMVALVATVTFLFRIFVTSPLGEAAVALARVAEGDLTERIGSTSRDEIGRFLGSADQMILRTRDVLGGIREASEDTTLASGVVRDRAHGLADGAKIQASSVSNAGGTVAELNASQGEVAENAESLRQLSDGMASDILRMVDDAGEVAREASGLSGSVEETSSAIMEMAASVKQVAINVESLSAAATQVVASVNEMASSIKEVERLSGFSAGIAEEVSREASDNGIAAVGRTREGMKRIEEAVNRSAEAFSRLNLKVDDIGGILDVIGDIADQTSLLALNAEILAAQAGEHGRGFSVVAGEVRQLAVRTTGSTREIGGLIKAVKAESKGAESAMAEGMQSVAEGSRLASDAEGTLRTIAQRAVSAVEMSRKIDDVTQQQAAGMSTIAQAVERINEMILQISRATHDQKSGNEAILATSERMRQFTGRVREATDRQAAGGKVIGGTVETVRDRVREISRATAEQRGGSHQIVEAIEAIREVVERNSVMAEDLTKTVERLSQQSAALKEQMARFTL